MLLQGWTQHAAVGRIIAASRLGPVITVVALTRHAYALPGVELNSAVATEHLELTMRYTNPQHNLLNWLTPREKGGTFLSTAVTPLT